MAGGSRFQLLGDGIFFVDVVRHDKLGFSAIKRGVVARQTDNEIVQLINLQLLKDGACGICFGLSLGWFPFPFEPALRWHRTVRSAHLDIFEQPQTLWSEEARDPDTFTASTCHGETCFKEELASVWQSTGTRILDWFTHTHTPEQIQERCVEQINRKWAGAQHWPDPILVSAFTLARLGRSAEARTQLREFLTLYQPSHRGRHNLITALEKSVQAKGTNA